MVQARGNLCVDCLIVLPTENPGNPCNHHPLSALSPPPTNIMPSLTERLLTIEDEFISALGQGEGALIAFNTTWEQLVADVEASVASASVNPETLTLVHSIATRIASFADTSIALYASYEDVNAQLINELDILMSDLSVSPRNHHTTLPTSCLSSTSRPVSHVTHGDRSFAPSRKRRRCFDDSRAMQDMPERRW